ncbi:cytochrome P450 [Marinicellulosiphila megalodicopiae]|uniref:cytochrome P450 n=1 Tax=Marinicellulosiphila megalodicopiae TaxID=2724896 RepID=UPI003BB1D9A3
MKAYHDIPKDPWFQSWKHSLQFVSNTTDFFDNQLLKHGQIFRCQLFGYEYVRTKDADITAKLYKNSQDLVSTANGWAPVFEGVFPNGLLLKDGKHHLVHRRIMQQAFNKKAMLVYFDCIKKWADDVADDLKSKQNVDFFKYIKDKTLDLSLTMFLGISSKDELGQGVAKSFVAMVASTVAIVRKPMFNNCYHRGIKARAHLMGVFLELVKQRRNNPGDDLISFLCTATDEENQAYSDEQIVDHIIFTMMAAHDTTASSLSSFMVQITEHSQWQQTLHQEALQFRDPNYEQLNAMSVAEHVYKETLRVMPPIVTVPRVLNTPTDMFGFSIPAGTRTGVYIYGAHHDPKYWTNPHIFDPKRFERGEDKNHAFCYIPFGGGVHKCIGMHLGLMEAKLVIQAIFSKLEVERVDPQAQIKYAKVPIWHPKGKFELRFKSVS